MKTLLTEPEIRAAVERLGREIADFYGDRPLTIIGVMTGSVMFLADLMRCLSMPLRVGVVQARSYGGGTTPGTLVVSGDFLPPVEDRDVLILDDIFDTGQTLYELVEEIQSLGPSSVRTAVLLHKQGRGQVPFQPDHIGLEIPDVFVVGYGLDYKDAWRHLPHIAVLEDADRVSS